MKPFKIELDGKVYEIDWSKFTAKKIKKLVQLQKRMAINTRDIDAGYEAIEFITGIPQEKLDELDIGEMIRICAFIAKEAERQIKIKSN